MTRRSGFTLLELLIVLGITAVLSTVAIMSLTGSHGARDLQDAKDEIGALLRQAQSQSVNQEGGESWGVYFDNTNQSSPFVALFSGTYSTSTTANRISLPHDIVFDTSFLASGATTDITFAQITGLPSASTSVTLDLAPNGLPGTGSAAGVSRTASGKIFFDAFNRTNL